MVESVMVKRTTRRVPFLANVAEAKDVRVTGDFTRWVKDGIAWSHNGDGGWRTVISLEPGEYQYRLLVDEEWKDHAEANRRVPNPFGTENCVFTVE